MEFYVDLINFKLRQGRQESETGDDNIVFEEKPFTSVDDIVIDITTTTPSTTTATTTTTTPTTTTTTIATTTTTSTTTIATTSKPLTKGIYLDSIDNQQTNYII